MTVKNAVVFKKISLSSRMRSMLDVDVKRMLRSRLFYILLATALIIPILMNVMMAMMDGTVSTDPQTGAQTVIHGPESVWQSVGTLPTADGAQMGGMDVMSMCNINMMFMLAAVFICLFISADFSGGFAKNLFTTRAKKGDYVISKTLVGFVCGALMLILYFVGALVGGAIAGLSFDLGTLSVANIVMCIAAKVFTMPVFISIFVAISVAAKQRAWLALCGSLGGGMLLFMTVPLVSPLESTAMNVLICLAGGVMFALGLGLLSRQILKKTGLV